MYSSDCDLVLLGLVVTAIGPRQQQGVYGGSSVSGERRESLIGGDECAVLAAATRCHH